MNVSDRTPDHVEVLDQARVLRYAGAATDFNPVHWDPDFAATASPTGTPIVHGMLLLGILGDLAATLADGPDRVLSLRATFRAPCPVGARVTFAAEVVATDPDAGTATLSLQATLEDGTGLVDPRRSRAVVRTT